MSNVIPYDRFLKAKLKEEMERDIKASGCVYAGLKMPCRHEPACELPSDVESV